MALIDELETLARLMRQLPEVEEEAERCQEAAKNALDNVAYVKEGIDEIRLRVCNLLMPPNIVVDGPQAPAQPVHPDAELRDAPPAASEESGDQSDDWTPTVQREEITLADLDKLATKASPEERAVMEGEPGGGVYAEPEIPEGFTKWEGGGIAVGDDVKVEVMCRTGHKWDALGSEIVWGHHEEPDDIIAYRILEAPAPEQPASVEIEPSPYAEAIEKGAITQDEADFLISERERIAAAEQAKFFAQGMMADADRHAQDQRSIVEKIGGLFKREKEDA